MTAILDLLNRRQQDWATLAKSDAGASGHFARGFAIVHKSVATFAGLPTDAVTVNDATMESSWTVSTVNMDREGDSLTPSGCMKTIQNYKVNPVVLLEHSAQHPIGISIGEKGLPLIIRDDCVKAILKHHDLTPVARDTWKLVKGGILRGASIAFLPLKAKQLGEISKGSLKSPRFLFQEWDCTHWAVTSQPQNPEAVRMSLSRGEIESDQFKKSLASFAEKPLEYARGWTPEEATMSKDVNYRDIQAVRISKAQYPDVAAAQAWLKSVGFDDSVQVEREKCWEFTQRQGEVVSSVKFGKGIEGMLLKAVVGEVPDERTIAIDETPDEVPPVVVKASEAPAEKKPVAKPKGPVRTTLAAQSNGDVMNLIAALKQYLTESMAVHDHDATVAFYQELADTADEMYKKVQEHAGTHFEGVDMNKVANDRAAAKEEEGDDKAGKDKKKQKSVDEINIEELQAAVAKRAPVLDTVEKSLAVLAENQKAVKERFKIVA